MEPLRSRWAPGITLDFVDLHAQGSSPVHIKSVGVVGVPPALKVDGVYAISLRERPASETAHGIVGSLSQSDFDRDYRGVRFHPVSDIVLVPGAKPDWYIVIVVEPLRHGRFTTQGIKLNYVTDGGEGSYTYTSFHMDVRCGPPAQGNASPSPALNNGSPAA